MKTRILGALVGFALCCAAPVLAQEASSELKIFKADDLVWQDLKIFKNAKIVYLLGGPDNSTSNVFRVKYPAHYKSPAFSVSQSQFVTVISGIYHTDLSNGIELKPGDSYLVPAAQAHHLWTGDEETVLQISRFGGPQKVTFVDPKDDPRNQADK